MFVSWPVRAALLNSHLRAEALSRGVQCYTARVLKAVGRGSAKRMLALFPDVWVQHGSVK